MVERALAPTLAEKASAEDHSEWVIWGSQYRGLEYGVEMKEGLHRVCRYLSPWLPIEVNARMLCTQNGEKRNGRAMQRVCMYVYMYVCNWWIV